MEKGQELLDACLESDFEKCKKLLENKDLEINEQYYPTMCVCRWTALGMASYNGDIKICKLLLKYDEINVNTIYDEGVSILNAIYLGHHELVKLLLAHGAIVDESDTIFDCDFDEDMMKILDNRKSYLPKWNRFTTAKFFPKEFNELAIAWLMCSKRLKLPKDMCYLIVEYIAEVWKFK